MCITRMRECVHAPKPGSMSSDAPSTHMFASCVLPVARHKWQEAQLQLPLSLHCVHTGGGVGLCLARFFVLLCARHSDAA